MGQLRRCRAAATTLLVLAACAGGSPPPALVSTERIEGEFFWRQRIHWRAARASGVFDAVVRKQSDELLVVLLDPLGSRLLSIRQRGLAVETDDPAPAASLLPPEAVLADIHRAFFWAPHRPLAGESQSRYEGDGWTVVERWEDGLLRERSFQAAGAAGPETIVTYVSRSQDDAFPLDLRIDNRRLGYRLEVRTFDRLRPRSAEPSHADPGPRPGT